MRMGCGLVTQTNRITECVEGVCVFTYGSLYKDDLPDREVYNFSFVSGEVQNWTT